MHDVACRPDLQFDRLLFAIDKGKSGDIERVGLETSLQELKCSYETDGPHQTLAESKRRKLVFQKMRGHIAGLRELLAQLGPFGKQEIARATWELMDMKNTLKAMRDVDLSFGPEDITAAKTKRLEELKELERLLEAKDLAIARLIDEIDNTRKKKVIRKTVVEPFLLILTRHEMWKREPNLTEVMALLFDWFGIKNGRPDMVGVRKIARDMRRDVQSFFRALTATKRRLTKIFAWRARSSERRLEAAQRNRDKIIERLEIEQHNARRLQRLMKIISWRMKTRYNTTPDREQHQTLTDRRNPAALKTARWFSFTWSQSLCIFRAGPSEPLIIFERPEVCAPSAFSGNRQRMAIF